MNPHYSVITWHPYPKEKPTKPNYYLVSTTKWGVDIDPCGDGEHWDYYTSEDIIAWAELPKPYEG